MPFLKQIVHLKLAITGSVDSKLIGYIDADWADDTLVRKSTSGYLFKFSGNTISWSSKTQTSVALSSTRAEYVSAALASQEAVWLQQLLEDMGIIKTEPITLFEDNHGCLKLADNEGMSVQTKHIDIKHHHLRDLVQHNVIKLEYCETNRMIADILTKPLPKPKLEELRAMIGIR